MAQIKVNYNGKLLQAKFDSNLNLALNSFQVETNGVFYTLSVTGHNITALKVTETASNLESNVNVLNGKAQVFFVKTTKGDLTRDTFTAVVEIDGIGYNPTVSDPGQPSTDPVSEPEEPSTDPVLEPEEPSTDPVSEPEEPSTDPASEPEQPPIDATLVNSTTTVKRSRDKKNLRSLFKNRI